MLIVDMNQVMISNFMAQIGNHTNIKIEEDLLRHMVLNSIRTYNHRFKSEYGEMVIACDDRRSWRKEIFPYYKANRKRDRDKSEIDWSTMFEFLERIKLELKENFPYRVIQVDRAEADDVIGTLVNHFGAILGDGQERLLIISGDKDFKQLQKYSNVRQYDPVRKRFLDEPRPETYLKEHIIRGDVGDGVPNFLSEPDCLVVGTRQKPIRQKVLDEWLKQEPEEFLTDSTRRYYERNRVMVDLDCTPDDIRSEVMSQYNEQAGKTRSKLFNYFVAKNLKHLMTDISQF